MDEYNDVAAQQSPAVDGDQMTTPSGWPGAGHAEYAPPAEPESAEAEPESEAGEETEAAPESEAGEEAEAAPEPEAAEDTEDAEAGPEAEATDESEADAEEEGTDGSEAVAEEEPAEEPAAEADAADEAEDAGDEAEDAGDEAEDGSDGAEEDAAAEEPVAETAADFTAEHLIDPEDAERFTNGWRDVKAAFVDDPPDAVRQASVLVGEAVDELTAALTRMRENLDGESHDVEGADTERLRLVLRGYGSLLDHILTR